MKFSEVLTLSLSTVLFLVGLHQLYLYSDAYGFSVGLGSSYWIFMLSGTCLLIYNYLKKDKKEKKKQETGAETARPANRKSRRKNK